MKSRDLQIFLALQVLAIVIAGLSFSLIESRLVAGAIAGLYFLSSGIYMLMRAWSWSGKWASACFYPLLIHVFAITLPMLISRFMQSENNFEEVTILGLPGPVFHRLSTIVFGALVLGTVIDLIRAKRTEIQPAQRRQDDKFNR